MSPEQVRGEKAGNGSDIFSFGCVLYEMVTGRRAFLGKSVTDTMAAILKDEPPAVAESGVSIAPDLNRVIERCLAKNPAQRFHSAHDLAFALRSLSSSSPESAEKPVVPPVSAPARVGRGRVAASVVALILILAGAGFYYWPSRASANIDSLAVLPFVNQSGSADTDWLSDGITESLINSLSELPKLKVMSRSAVFRYKGKDSDPRATGKELGVRAVLTGRLTQHGDDLSVSAELVNVDDNTQLWGDLYKRKLADVLSVQRDIATQISGKLRAKLNDAQKTQIHRGQTDNSEAYQLYLKGRFYTAKFDSENLNKGFDYFRQAIALDPNYALAYDGLSYYYQIVEDLYFPVGDVMPKAKEAARKALEIDDNIAESHVEVASVDIMYDAWYLTAVGRINEAVSEARHAEELDPLSTETSAFTGWWLYFGRRYDDAATQLKKCLDLDPDYPICLWELGQVYEEQGRYADALATEAKILKMDPGWSWVVADSGRAYVRSGNRAQAQRALDELLARSNSKSGHVSRYSVAGLYAALGDKKHALDLLDQCFAERSFFLDFVKSDPKMDSLRSESRFQDLVRRMNFPR